MRLSLDELLHLFAHATREVKITPWGYMHELDLGETANMLVKVIRVNDGHRNCHAPPGPGDAALTTSGPPWNDARGVSPLT